MQTSVVLLTLPIVNIVGLYCHSWQYRKAEANIHVITDYHLTSRRVDVHVKDAYTTHSRAVWRLLWKRFTDSSTHFTYACIATWEVPSHFN